MARTDHVATQITPSIGVRCLENTSGSWCMVHPIQVHRVTSSYPQEYVGTPQGQIDVTREFLPWHLLIQVQEATWSTCAIKEAITIRKTGAHSMNKDG